MCGILFKVSKTPSPSFETDLSVLDHRGPDGSGYLEENRRDWIFQEGHTRLSILDLSNAASQPMTKQRVTLLYNGEIYNYEYLRKVYNLIPRSTGDTEVLLDLYINYGFSALTQLRGEFAYTIIDSRGKYPRVYAGRDSLGVKPLYYKHTGDELFISSEIRGIQALSPSPISMEQFSKLIVFGYSGNKTLFSGIEKVKQGETLEFTIEENTIRRNHFPKKSLKRVYETKKEPTLSNLKSSIETAVERRMIADVPVSSTLSGGVDSTIITTIASRLNPGINTYTIGIEGVDDELTLARDTARRLKTHHHEVLISMDEVFSNMENIVSIMEEPSDKGSLVPTYFLAQAVEDKVTLVGEGADEIFGGYNRHKIYLDRYYGILNKDKKFEDYFNENLRLFKGDKNIKWNDPDYFIENPASVIGNRVLKYDIETELVQFHNARLDKMFMANSIEARTPYLDEDLVSLALSFKFASKFYPEKKPLRRAFEGEIPANVLNRPKAALKMPFDSWLERKEVLSVLKNSILPDEVFSQEDINKLLETKKEQKNTPRLLWLLYLSNIWYNQNKQYGILFD